MDHRIVRRAYRLRDAYARSLAAIPHFRSPAHYGGGGVRSQGLPLSEAIDQATAIERADDEGLTVENEEEHEAWDGDCEAPRHLFCVVVRDAEGHVRASLGMVGVNDLDDPYLDTVAAELFAEVLGDIDAERDAATSRAAEALASRATFAGPQP